ncbi:MULTISPECIES: metallophosphatase [Cyanophyceae]|uniref:metallophosphatase n=1 Tax=Cyanophyceae TaxID=3028117 RepID=UPI00232DAA23|nr:MULTISPECIES: metallophosphatase [Cyanophyceae]MDB9319306.1 metallophosphatase [Nodularia spumigena CS-590/01A]MDB9321335.1 metallophosphatase [Nodularia spumigena CS-591/07A]MDB9325336.1 metallophosphatase [Nodularia spumigena CS-590/02]MDB9330008.1 metallophosphatase [Nodularia spumigena CS-591/04]MDB9333803.1 metallophosphatase [Nodularia spumigena CS-590/01]
MNKWAILSGIEGNLTAYEAVMADIQRQNNVEALYILGDLVGPRRETEQLVKRVLNPRRGELEPLICKGWWEEQCFILHGLGGTDEPTELIQKYGGQTVKLLWEYVSRPIAQWLMTLDFGFFELDSLLIHGTTLAVDEELTPDTPPIQMLDRLSRMQANNLFCGRSGLAFQYQLQAGSITTEVTTLDSPASPQTVQMSARQVIGVGNVGGKPGEAIYTLFHPETNYVEFKTVRYLVGKGFQSQSDIKSEIVTS